MLASDVWVPRDVCVTSPSDMWGQSVYATNMWGQVNSQHGLGLKRAPAGFGLGRAGPDTWQAVALPRHGRGPLLGFVHSSRAWAWLMVDQEVLVHGPQIGLRWTESTLLLSGAVLVHRVHSRVAGEGGVPLFLPQRCSCRRRARCEPQWQCWCPIGEGKGFPGPRRS